MSLKKTLVIVVAALSATAFLGTSAQAARVKWKMHSAWGSQIPVLGSEAVRFADHFLDIERRGQVTRHSAAIAHRHPVADHVPVELTDTIDRYAQNTAMVRAQPFDIKELYPVGDHDGGAERGGDL